MEKSTLRKGFTLSHWRVIPDQGIISAGEEKHHLEPKVMAVLVELAFHQGEVLSRDQLISSIWETTFVTDEVLSRAISLLRNKLGDNAKEPLFIQTVPKQGYRLICPITVEQDAPSDVEPSQIKTRQRRSPLIAALFAALALAMGLLLFNSDDDSPRSQQDFVNIGEWFDFLEQESKGSKTVTSLAVLPFYDLNEQGDTFYFSDSLTDEIIISLSKIPGLKVVSRRSSSNFRNRAEDMATIGRLLNVDAVLEGTLRANGDQLRIATQLSSAKDGFVLWSETYNRPLEAAFDIQADISGSIATALKLTLTGTPLTSSSDSDAYQLFLNGRFFWKMRGEQPLRKSIALFEQALELDPQFNRARIGLAQALALLPFYSDENEQAMFQLAQEKITDIQFNNNLERAEVEALKGFIAQHSWQWLEAERAYQESLRLAPDIANTYNWYSEFLGCVGRNRDAVQAIERGKQLDGVSPVINDRLGVAYMWANDNLRAAESFAAGAQLGFSNLINPGYLIFAVRQKRVNELEFIFEGLYANTENRPLWLMNNLDKITNPENHEQLIELALAAEQKGTMIHPRLQFGLWTLLGGIDRAYQTFDRFKENQKQFLQMELIFSEEGRAFREDRKFRTLAKQIGLTEYWDQVAEPDYKNE